MTDPRGNVTQMIARADQKVKAAFNYGPYGEDKGTDQATKDWDSRLKFQMAPKDPTTGSYTIGPRVMDPGINRFVGADMYVVAAANLGLQLDPLTGNRYLYAGANPIGMIDDGHKPMFDECKPRPFDSYSRDERRKLVKAGRYCLGSGRFNGTPQPNKRTAFRLAFGN